MVLRTVAEQEVSMDELVLEQLVTWVKKLKEVGVSPDKAVEVAQNFMLASMAVACEEEGDDDFEDEDN